MTILFKACLAFLKISVFCFGGGYAAVGLLQKEIVEKLALISMEEYLDMVAIAEMTPGPIAINVATFVGNRLGGIVGGILCSVSFILLPVVIALIVVLLFVRFKNSKYVKLAVKGIRPVAIAIIAAAAVSIAKVSFIDWVSLLIFAVSAAIVFLWKKGPILAILVSGALGILFYGVIFA